MAHRGQALLGLVLFLFLTVASQGQVCDYELYSQGVDDTNAFLQSGTRVEALEPTVGTRTLVSQSSSINGLGSSSERVIIFASDPQVVVWVTIRQSLSLLGCILAVVLVSWAIFGSGGKMYSLLACGVYLIVSVSIDVSISIQKSKTGEYELDPMCAVCLVELIKLIVSLGLHSYNCRTNDSNFVPDRLSSEDAKWLLLPSLGYTANNILVWNAIGQNDLATFGIFRDTMVFWTAAIWFFTFWVPLGGMRILGLALILVGIVVSQASKVAAGFSFNLAAFWVLLMTLTNAVSSVANEKALKRNFGLDLNVQNSIMYSMMTVISIIVIAFSKPGKLLSLTAFFEGFSVYTVLTVCLQAGAGLLVSRLLKYADATMKTVATCLRGPSLVLLTTAPPITISSAMIVMSGCMIYLFQGPVKVPDVEDSAQKLKAQASEALAEVDK
jgi:hypothetical protein